MANIGGGINAQAKAFAQWLLAAIEKGDGTWCSIDQWQMDYDYERCGVHGFPTVHLDMRINTSDIDGLHAAIMGRFDGPEETVAEETEVRGQGSQQHVVETARRAGITQATTDRIRELEAIEAAFVTREQQHNNRTLREKMIEILTQEGLVCADEIDLDISLDSDLDTKEVKAIKIRRKVKW